MKLRFCILLLFAMNLHLSGQKTSKPNIVLIYADDLGWADLTCYGSTFYETPNLDKLAKEGVQFLNGYATAPVCSPSRASLMTGKYPVKTGITDWITGRQAGGQAKSYEKMIAKPINYNLALEEKTLAEYGLKNGYQTFFAGKWHLGESEQYWPERQGFEINIGGFSKGSPVGLVNDTVGGFFTPYKNPRMTDGPAGEYLTDRLADECVNFLNTTTDQPFLMVYSLYAVHNPMQAPTALVNKYKQKQKDLRINQDSIFRKDEAWMAPEKSWKQRVVQSQPVYAAMVENMDTNIGKIMRKLQEMGIADNTMVIFTSDNGGLSTSEGSPTTNFPLRAGKGWMYEGGIRVPFIIKWPGQSSKNHLSDIPVQTADIFATCIKAMGEKTNPKEIDGKPIQYLIKNPKNASKRSLYWHYPHYSNQGGKPSSAILQYPYKLIYNHEDKSYELYNLKTDQSEQQNLSGIQSKISKKMSAQLQQWFTEVNAVFPDQNPKYLK